MAEPKRKVIKTIPINNGKLTFEIGESGGNWYRNGKLIKNVDDYKYYDKKVNRYRRLGSTEHLTPPERAKYDGQTDIVPLTPIYMENFNKVVELQNEEVDRLDEIKNNFEQYPVGDRFIDLRTKGKMNLATVPINMLDTIAINSGRSNTNIKTNLGLIGKESTFGGYSKWLKNPWPVNYYVPHHIVNNHAYDRNAPISDYLDGIQKQIAHYNIAKNKERGLGLDDMTAIYDDELLMKIEDDLAHKLKYGFPETTKRFSNNYFEDAFLRYADNPARYNYGQKNYVPMVNNIANEVWNEPQIQKWWETEGKNYYEKGKKERKQRRSLED